MKYYAFDIDRKDEKKQQTSQPGQGGKSLQRAQICKNLVYRACCTIFPYYESLPACKAYFVIVCSIVGNQIFCYFFA